MTHRLGISFDYPSNWTVDTPPAEPLGEGPYTISIRNYENDPLKGDKTTDQLRIDIIIGRPGLFASLEAWTARFRDTKAAGLDANISMTPVENFEIAGVPAVRWTQTAEAIPQGNVVVGFRKNGRMYVFSSYPATSKYMADLEEIITSFRFP